MKKVVSGNKAVAYGVMLSRVQVISAYPHNPPDHDRGGIVPILC
jgi:pyruvate/2-oxoacid:ferredoxin oxidoreductase alpha subunit